MRILTFGVAVVVVGFFVARPYLDHRPLSLEEQAAIVGGEKGKVCRTPSAGSGGVCNGTNTNCNNSETACQGKMAGDTCDSTWKDFRNPDRCGNTTDTSICCDDQGGQTEDQVPCVIERNCKCVLFSLTLQCREKGQQMVDQSLVYKCVSGPCPDEEE